MYLLNFNFELGTRILLARGNYKGDIFFSKVSLIALNKQL